MALLLLLWLSVSVGACSAATPQSAAETDIDYLLLTVTGSAAEQTNALNYLQQHWQPEFTPMLLETIYLIQSPSYAIDLIKLLEAKTGQSFGYDINAWYAWLWNRPPLEHPLYADFKSRLYRLIDPKFAAYFDPQRTSRIRLDEIRWGGVRQDGIPPLRYPNMIAAADAGYLADDNIVFGVAINGDVRA
jgi:hypothetical protein